MIIGVVADDVTGANDIGSMFAKRGYRADVYAYDHFESLYRPEADVCIIDTNSRLDASQIAYDKVFAATKALMQAGCQQFHNKTCSVFRGNIGVEFDAMLDALEQDFAIVILGFPQNGRTTVDGVHYVRGVRLEESEFRRDPVHPMTISNLVDILQSQTKRRVGAIHHGVIEQGRLKEQLETMRGDYSYVILDVTDQAMLKTIASVVHEYPVLCGSSAIAEELPAYWNRRPRPHNIDVPRQQGQGVICAAGSLMPQTAAQIEYLRERSTPIFELDALALFDHQEQAIAQLADTIIARLNTGDDVVFHAPNDPQIFEQMHAEGASRGLARTDVSRMVSAAVAEVVAICVERCGLNRLLVAGGETSAAVCDRLGIYGVSVSKEIQPGLPLCISLTEPPLLLVLKSGSFGSKEFFAQAIEQLKE
jgi:uncharacterized protein YgbK (DUF1537 family)